MTEDGWPASIPSPSREVIALALAGDPLFDVGGGHLGASGRGDPAGTLEGGGIGEAAGIGDAAGNGDAGGIGMSSVAMYTHYQ